MKGDAHERLLPHQQHHLPELRTQGLAVPVMRSLPDLWTWRDRLPLLAVVALLQPDVEHGRNDLNRYEGSQLLLTKLRAAAVSAVAILTAVAVFDESNVISIVARKAVELITKFLGLTA